MRKQKHQHKVGQQIFILILLLLYFHNHGGISTPIETTLLINEIMYHPLENDNYFEWIELYNPNHFPVNVLHWTISDGGEEDTLEPNTDNGTGTTIIPEHGYALITDKGTQLYNNLTIPSTTVLLYVDDSALCSYGLNNENERLFLNTSTGTLVDSIEWGYDYHDVPGHPAPDVNQGNSLCRYPNTDTDNSRLDFYYGITPTPGQNNIVDLDIDLYPQFIGKIPQHKKYSIPFGCHITIQNLVPQQPYHLKTYVLGDLQGGSPATQTWAQTTWKYSDNYSTTLTTDTQGCWSDWQYLRFNHEYQQYKNHIHHNHQAYLIVKFKQGDCSYDILKKIHLLDLDSTHTNGTTGGYAIGIAKNQNIFLENTLVIIENTTRCITNIYRTENNSIDEGLIPKPGYYKIPSPVGENYTLRFIQNNTDLCKLSNLRIQPGDYQVQLSTANTTYYMQKSQTLQLPLRITNIGDLADTITLSLHSISPGFTTDFSQQQIMLGPQEFIEQPITIRITQSLESAEAHIKLYAQSHHDPGVNTSLTIDLVVQTPDLLISNLSCYDLWDQQNTVFSQGETIHVKATIKNTGAANASTFTVTYYYDHLDSQHCIGAKEYTSIGKYQKYPRISWDTSTIQPGNHTLIIVVDENNSVEELNEQNNMYYFNISITDTAPPQTSRSLVFTQIYYHNHPGVRNEFITLYNPSNTSIAIGNWYITNTPEKPRDEQKKIIFPINYSIAAKTSVVLVQNATWYTYETGKQATWEYADDSTPAVPQLTTTSGVVLSNTGCALALKNPFNHTIDIIIYGETSHELPGWYGPPVQRSGEGVILTRNTKQDFPMDTNTSDDWIHPRIYGIGQSDFRIPPFLISGEIQTFVSPDCSHTTIVDALRSANSSIHVNMYEFTDPFLYKELLNALNRNVSVCMFMESAPIGGLDDREKYMLSRIYASGGNIRFITNKPDNKVFKRYRFDHAKYAIIDNSTVIVESCNWAKTGVPKNNTYGNREWGVIVHDTSVATVFLTVFYDDWNENRCDSCCFSEMNYTVSPDFYVDETIYSGQYTPRFCSQRFQGESLVQPVFSPDNSQQALLDLIEQATQSIYIEQLYIYKNWDNRLSPLVEKLVNKSQQGVDIRIIMNYNPFYEDTNDQINLTREYFLKHGIQVKYVYTNWSYFSNMHNKGMIVDNTSVLISSINWNENSITANREAGIIITNPAVASYYADVFFVDWHLAPMQEVTSWADYKNPLLVVGIYILVFMFIAHDWSKRQWL